MPVINLRDQRKVFLSGTEQNGLWLNGEKLWSKLVTIYNRTVSTSATRHVHSGHSLTDTYTSGTWPGFLNTIRNALFPSEATSSQTLYHLRSTIPGSATEWRWNNYEVGGVNARYGISNYDSLMITERGLNDVGVSYPGITSDNAFLADILHELKFAVNTWQNGSKAQRPTEYILWSIWPSTAWTNWETILSEYEERFKYRADYITWKMHQLFPDLPDDWRVWVFPGHLYIKKLIQDINSSTAVGFTSVSQLYYDDIHPDVALQFGLSAFVSTALYQRDLRLVSGITLPPEVTQEQANYFYRIAWEICTSYEPVGMNGTEGTTEYWTEEDVDHFPTLTTPSALLAGTIADGTMIEPETPPVGTDLPDDTNMKWSALGYTGPTVSGTAPLVNDGYLTFNDTRKQASASTETGQYVALRFRQAPSPDSANFVANLFALRTGVASFSTGIFILEYNAFANSLIAYYRSGGVSANQVQVILPRPAFNTWSTVETWLMDGSLAISLNGATPTILTVPAERLPITQSSYIHLFTSTTNNTDVMGLRTYRRVPTDAERIAIREWLESPT